MKLLNFLNLSINVLLVAAGFFMMVVPAYNFFSYVDREFGSDDAIRGWSVPVRGAINSFFIKDQRFDGMIVPDVDANDPERISLPAQVTPEAAAKFMMAQAQVNSYVAEAKIGMTFSFWIVVILGAIGLISVLVGLSLLLMQRKLDRLLDSKNK
ncbi:MAG: hypothetical protein MUD10_03870 [Candidatus Pacebacteria bacterium]|jgi:hypothetical protein|nr:hypothetical protein [Candidatus Paceibacterota bacterium]